MLQHPMRGNVVVFIVVEASLRSQNDDLFDDPFIIRIGIWSIDIT